MTDLINEEEELLPREESESSSGACDCYTPPGETQEDCEYWCPGNCNVARTAHCGDDCEADLRSSYCDAECTQATTEFCDGAGCQEPMEDFCCGECNEDGECAPGTPKEDLCDPEDCTSMLQEQLCCDDGCNCQQKRYYCDDGCTDLISNYCNNDCATEPCDDGKCPSIYCGNVCPEDAEETSSDGKRRSELCPMNCSGLPLIGNQVCCEGEPVEPEKCCDGTKVPDDGSVCCDNQIVSGDKCCAGKVIPDGEKCCGEDETAVIATECCGDRALADAEQCCGGGIEPESEVCCGDAENGQILQDGETCCNGKISQEECCGPNDNPVGEDERCCEDTVVSNATGCCDDKISPMPCCNVDGVSNVVGEDESCCNGVGVYNDSTHICCETDGVIKTIDQECEYDDSCCGGNCAFGADIATCNSQSNDPDIGGCGCASNNRDCKTNEDCESDDTPSSVSDPHVTTFFGEKYTL
jgi:hypothetical protein